MKKIALCMLIAAVFAAWTVPFSSAAEKKAEESKAKAPEKKIEAPPDANNTAMAPLGKQVKQVMQGELAQLLVNVLGLSRFLPAGPTPQQCFMILMANNIFPVDGWKTDAVVTKADLARLIVQAMKKQQEVKNPDDPKAWIDYLKSIGIPIDTIGEAVDYVEPLPEPVAPNVYTGNTDPLVKRQRFNPTDETQYGADMVFIARVFSELELVAGEFRPTPITQD